ncbi:MAG TPA: DEAD/DEAH box helicase [Candidatus Acidoferrum sp.]|nr:DEAD/DEAH box helicase [Candidatus Acidoferrum sp.]
MQLNLEPAAPSSLDWAHPLVRDWFVSRFGTPTEPQEQGWPHILAGSTTLICAPTGSGKTLAAFLACIDRLVRKALAGELRDETEVLYISPLKALSNDIRRNLEIPLSEILALAGQRGLLMPEIRAAVRTGDTLMHERRAMLDRPPHILVTTPESAFILLTAGKSREILRSVKTVIVDEIHAVADDARGAHLALSLERLDALTGAPPVRIGLSATQKPIELIGQFLAGSARPEPVIVEIENRRRLDIAIEVPPSELGPVATNEMWDEIYKRLAELVNEHRSTLIFVNTRRLAERVGHHLAELLGEGVVASHHGSLSRQRRFAVEAKLKAGELRALVATASLELGIDIGSVDLVCQIGSPRAIAVALQRIGRAGHWRGATPKGRIFATTRDELIECAALVWAIRDGDLDQIQVPDAPLDVMAQQIVAACAAEEWKEEDLFALVRRAYPYRNLSRETFESIIEILSEGIAARRGRYAAYLHRDRVNGVLRGRRGSRLAAITSGGAIPDNSLYSVILEPEHTVVGTIDEDFAVESLRGDIFLLGNTSWRIRSVRGGAVQVEDAKGAAPNVPFWRGEAPARTAELSQRVAQLRERIDSFLPDAAAGPVRTRGAEEDTGEIALGTSGVETPEENAGIMSELKVRPPKNPVSFAAAEANGAVEWLKSECGLDDAGAEQAIEHVLAGRTVLGVVPSQQTIVAERFFDEGGGMQLVIHAPFGGRINKAWGLALRKRFCRSFNFELQAAATDDGLNISLSDQHSFPLADVFHFLHPESVRDVLEQAVLASPIFTTRWRWVAGRALALLRFQHGKKVPPQIQRMRSDDLLAAVFPEALACQENIVGDIRIPDHPLVGEAMKETLTEAMDIDGLTELLRAIGSGQIRCVAVDTPVPSQFAHEILNANPYAYLDDAPLEERRARAVEMRRTLPEAVLSEVGRLDPAAIREVVEEAWPDVRDSEELHDSLLTLVALPERFEQLPSRLNHVSESLSKWRGFFSELQSANRVSQVGVNGREYWVAAERTSSFSAVFPGATFEAAWPQIEADISRDDALRNLLTGWLSHIGPCSSSGLASILGIPQAEIDKGLLRLEASGTILQGRFTDDALGKTEWCDRRLLARIHRLTVGKLRSEIQPVNAAQFMRWLLRWQHVAPGTQGFGERGTLEALRQLQGFEAPSNAWERHLLRARIANYDPKVLDRLCLTGAVGWGRLSPHPAILRSGPDGGRRAVPTSAAPITFFVREDADWFGAQHTAGDVNDGSGLSANAREVLTFLRQRGASFFVDIVRGTRKLKSEIETALWELVAVGMITADDFDNLRALIDPRRRAGRGTGRIARPRHSGGRWCVLQADEQEDRAKSVEAVCWMLLRRYGVVFRELMERESIVPKWREVLIALRRLEDRGEIRGGRFVSGFLGEQFALPVAVESLRAIRSQQPTAEIVTISAADPLNLTGIVVPGERIAANSGTCLTLRDGILVDDGPASVLPAAIASAD